MEVSLIKATLDILCCMSVLEHTDNYAQIVNEFARVLKPGGRLVVVDSLQRGDEPDYDGMLELFPQNFHEPYYAGYIEEDFGAIADGCGLAQVRSENAFIAKVMVFDKPA